MRASLLAVATTTLLLGALGKAHVLFGHGFGDRFGVEEVVLV
jgi:hypothetical protein